MGLILIGTKRFEDFKKISVKRGFRRGAWVGIALFTVGTTDAIIKMTSRPSISSVTIPGGLGLKDLSPILLEKISATRTELETYHQQELRLAEEQEIIESELIKREELKAKIKKAAPLVVIGLVGGGLYLTLRRKK